MPFYLIDKPINFTSFDVISVLRGKLQIKKIGHTGTLDPLATGCLLVASGNDTKLIPYFEKDKKEYFFKANFNGKSASYDLGTPVEYISTESQKKAKKEITKEKIEKLLKEKFTGKIFQVPPKYSAIKISGKKALKKILDGEDFEMKKRECYIYEIELLSFSYPEASFRAIVSPGTYIRSLAYDLGEELRTGGYITVLTRLGIGNLSLQEAQNLKNFDKDKFLDVKKIFIGKEFIELDEKIISKLSNGISVSGKFEFKIGEELFVFDGKKISNIVIYDGKILIPKKNL